MSLRRRDLLSWGRTLIAGRFTDVVVPANRVDTTRATVASRFAAQATNWSHDATIIQTQGDLSPGDGGAALWRRVETEPEHLGKFEDAGGGWWEIVPSNGTLDARALGARTSGDATAAVQAALDVAALHAPCTVQAIGGRYRVEEVEVPPGVTLLCDLKRLTPPKPGVERNCVRVNPGCAVVGRIEGVASAAAEVVERGIYPAVEGCHDVHLDVEVVGTTVAVQALFGSPLLAEPPRRWTGRVWCRDVVGFEGGSNGYGVNGTLCDSTLLIFSKNVPRHSLYLVAGASNNHIEIHDDGGRYAPIDIASFEGQPVCRGNVIKAHVRNHKSDYPFLAHYAGLLFGNCLSNTIELHVTDSEPLDAAFMMQAASAAAFPRGNELTVYFDGEIKGSSVIECNSGSGNRLRLSGRGTCRSRGVNALVRVARNDRIVPDFPDNYAASIELINFDCVGGWDHAVVAVVDYAKVDLGQDVIRAPGVTGSVVQFFSFGDYVTGWVFEPNLSATSPRPSDK